MVAAQAIERDWIEWLLIIATLAGVTIAIYQSIQSGRVAKGARKAVERAESRLAGNQFLVASAQLETLESDLLAAATAEDRERTTLLLIRWRQTANELLGLASTQTNPDAELIRNLKGLAGAATEAQMSLEDLDKGTRVQTKRVRAEIAATLGKLRQYAGQLKATTAEEWE